MIDNHRNHSGADRKQILKDSAHYLTSTLAAQGFGLLRSVLLPVLLIPAQLGIWNLMNVIVGYGANAHFGLLHGFNKKVPALQALGNERELDELKDSVFWFNLFLGLIAGSLLFLASFLIGTAYSSASRIIALVVILQMIFVFYFSLLRADSRFEIVSNGIAGLSFLSTILVLLLAYISDDRLLGALYGLLAAYPFIIVYWYYKGGYRFALRLKWAQIRDAFGIGLPLIILGLIDMVLLSVDRWIIAWQLPDSALGYYALGIMASNVIGLVPIAAANVLYPRMLARFASTQNYGSVGNLMLNPIRAVGAVMIFLISACTIILPVVIHLFLPKYTPAIPLVEILVPGAFFLAIAPIAGSYVIAIDRQIELIKIQIVAIAVCLLLYGILLNMGYGVRGIAYGTVCGYAIYGFGYLGIAAYLANGKWMDAISLLIHLSILFGVLILALKITDFVVPVAAAHWADRAFFPFLRLLVVSAALAPFVWLVNRNSGLLSTIWAEFTIWRTAKNNSL